MITIGDFIPELGRKEGKKQITMRNFEVENRNEKRRMLSDFTLENNKKLLL